jgi:hypothetical protein
LYTGLYLSPFSLLLRNSIFGYQQRNSTLFAGWQRLDFPFIAHRFEFFLAIAMVFWSLLANQMGPGL